MYKISAPTKFEIEAYPIIKNIFSHLLSVAPERLLVAPFTSPSGPSHWPRGLFPSISIDIGENTLIDRYNLLTNPKKRLWAISPDYTVLLKDDIDEVLEFDKKAEMIDPRNRHNYVSRTIDHLEKDYEKKLQEILIHKRPRPALWLFSNDMKENIINDSVKEGRYRILLKKDSLPRAVVDCKYYHHNIPSSQIRKLVFDARLSGAKDCYIYTMANITCWKTEMVYNNGVKLFRIQDYNQPQIIDRVEFSNKYKEIIKMFN